MSEPAAGIAPRQGHPSGGVMRWLAVGLVLAIVLAALALPLINIQRYHRTIAESLSRSLGRPVHLGSVQLQLLPHPGLALTDFVVDEDPGFGAEPLLRAPSVTVSLRPISLWRGRLEVSRIDLDNASVNLVRDTRGQWNFGSLLIQAARIPNAPTAQRHATAELRFPYIEFRSARINFKSGAEKKAFSFLSSDCSIWLAEPDQWQLRFEAQPARTDLDLDLADTGLMRVEGSLNRASALDQMQVKLHAEWSKAPLGQVSRMIFGQDSGWRGLLRSEADFAGDIRNLEVKARFRVDNAHRQEFTPITPLNIDARCRGNYQHAASSIDNLTCLWPVGDGHLLLTGNVTKLTQPEEHLNLEINHTPVSFAVTALGLLRQSMTPALGSTGLINGHFEYSSVDLAGKSGTPELTGEAVVDSLTLNFSGVEKPLMFPALHFATPNLAATAGHAKRKMSKKHAVLASESSARMAILLESAPLALGAPSPLELSGQFTATGFTVRVAGQADLNRLAALSKSAGLLGSSLADVTPPSIGPEATAALDLTLSGPWMTPVNDSSGAPTTTLGWLRIEHAQAKLDWLPEPVEITSATANFSPDKITWSNASLAVNGIATRGSLIYPLHCNAAAECPASDIGGQQGNSAPIDVGRFNIDIPSLNAAALESALIGAGRHNEFLSAILAEVGRKTAPWPPLDGTIHVGVFSLGNLALRDAHGSLSVHGNRLEITSLNTGTLGGSAHFEGSIDTTGSRPAYSLNIDYTGISVAQTAALFHENWGTGSVNGNAKLTLEGYSASDLASSAHGTFQWDWTNGSLTIGTSPAGGPTLTAATSARLEKASLPGMQTAKFSPAHFTRWLATGTITDRTLKFKPADRTNPVSGTISFDRQLDLQWPARDASMLHIGGTLAHPVFESPQTVSEH